ncbi:MAG TPA: ATP-binding protein [Thermoanaerobaculia bacterium]
MVQNLRLKSPRLTYLLRLGILTSAYLFIAQFGLLWATAKGAASPVFPAVGVALAALLLWGRNLWPAVFIGRLLAFWIVPSVDQPFWMVLVVSGGNALTAFAGAWVLQKAHFDPAMRRLRDVAWFLVWGAVGSSAIGATVGAAAVTLASGSTFSQFAIIWTTWWSSNVGGTIVVAPLILVWSLQRGESRGAGYWLHLGASIAVAVAITWAVFGGHISPMLRTWLIFPVLIWGCLAFGVRGATALMLPISLAAVWAANVSDGPLGWDVDRPLLFVLIQQFLVVAGATSLLLAVAADERRGKEALRQSEERLRLAMTDLLDQKNLLRTITDNVDSALLLIDVEGRATFVNPAFTRITGFERAEAVGQVAHDLIHSKHPDGALYPIEACPIGRPQGAGSSAQKLEETFIRRDGSFFPVSISIAPLQKSGVPSGGVVEFRDITIEKQAREEREALLARERSARQDAERASRVKDEFLATLSHELRTPLSAVLGWAQLLQISGQSGGMFDEALTAITRNAKLQVQLIDDLLDMSRITLGKLRLELRPVSLSDVLHAAAHAIAPSASVKDLRVTINVDDDRSVVHGDPDRLQQVFWNLLTNAVKFTPAGGQIEILMRHSNGEAVVEIHDSGMGIDSEFIPHIFERFRQADASTTRRHGGLGIGLALVRQLVEIHGGRVAAESEGEGRGSTFTVALPSSTAELPAKETAGEPMNVEASRLAGIRVLLVDDDADAREVSRRLLTSFGAVVTAVGTAEEGFAHVTRQHFDILLSDIAMPEEDGVSFIRRVRARPGSSRLPAVAVTALSSSEDRARVLEAGFDAFLPKPADPTELVNLISALSERGS